VTFPGVLVTAAGARVHVVVDGAPGARPVLLGSGLGGAWFDWRPTVDLLRASHRVISYDRPGLGGSPGDRAAPSLRGEAARLAALARWAGPPVIVAAHSYAAFHAEALARIAPDLLAGLVLVDPSCAGDARAGVRLSRPIAPLARAAGALAGATGVARLLGPWARGRFMRRVSDRDAAPPELVRMVYGRGTVIGTALAEHAAYRDMAADLAGLRRTRPFPEIPLTVLTALGDLPDAGHRAGWAECHRRLAAMSPYGRQITVAGARHLLQADRPDAVADAIAGTPAR
jgi:pimeloyl-ACP methyl ester carboxylesterase